MIKTILKNISKSLGIYGFVKGMYITARRLYYRGNRFDCPLCTRSYRLFLPFGFIPRPNAMCPGCGALERHRLLWVALTQLWNDNILQRGGRMLHVAPESILEEKFKQDYEYLSVDLDGSVAMQAMDITAISFPDNTFDAIICNHVLEHIPDDRQAMSELYRVMKYGGWGSLQVPIKGEVTDEDLTITDSQERTRRFGQHDHVRYYGRRDYIERLKSVGFEVISYPKQELLTATMLKRLSVDIETDIILVRKS